MHRYFLIDRRGGAGRAPHVMSTATDSSAFAATR